MSSRFVLLAGLALFLGFALSSCAPTSAPNLFSSSGDGRTYNPVTHNFEQNPE